VAPAGGRQQTRNWLTRKKEGRVESLGEGTEAKPQVSPKGKTRINKSEGGKRGQKPYTERRQEETPWEVLDAPGATRCFTWWGGAKRTKDEIQFGLQNEVVCGTLIVRMTEAALWRSSQDVLNGASTSSLCLDIWFAGKKTQGNVLNWRLAVGDIEGPPPRKGGG